MDSSERAVADDHAARLSKPAFDHGLRAALRLVREPAEEPEPGEVS
jgi:hypothetical protein